ncbi:MAG: hypothetical protein IJD92_02035 [Bacilli bacterium]|nr:hypothetical protein [Bacilli bacterium]
MNTRQKLTLGIAAIFMVTLTIVGVTYAYFVTRVVEGTQSKIETTTATLATVEYLDGNDTITLANAIPGETSSKKTFSVKNNNDAPATYSIVLTSEDGATKFISTTDAAACYNASTEDDTNCYTGSTKYNNVYYRLYEVDAAGDAVGNPLSADGATLTLSDTVFGVNVERTGENTVQTILNNVSSGCVTAPDTEGCTVIAAGDTKYYVLELYYADAKANQNIENLASLSVKVDIQ